MPNPMDTVKNHPWKTVLAVIPVLIAIIYFAIDVRSWIVTQEDLNDAKREIINELRDESAKIRTAYLHDLESRLEDVEVEMESLEAMNKIIPTVMRRRAKRLLRRINEITSGIN